MAKEFRCILFSPDEVLPALLQHLGYAEARQPSLQMFEAAGQVLATLSWRGGRPDRVSVTADDLLGALLARCRAMRIPLPVRGHKTLELMGGMLALTITLDTDMARSSAMQGAVRYLDAEADALRERVG